MSQPAIELEDLNKSLAGKQVLKNITFQVDRGDIFGYIGPNGAGKTTTIRVILGLFPPDSGRASILGRDPRNDPARSKLGFVLDTDGLYENMTAFENVEYYARIYGVRSTLRAEKVRKTLQLVDLSARTGDHVSTYSKGMRQKLALARSLIHDPELLVLDEPTAGIDPTGRIEVRQMILDMAKKGKTIFVSSHNLDEAQRICNRVALIDQGEIRLCGELDKLRGQRHSREIVIQTEPEGHEDAERLDGILPNLQGLPYVVNCRREDRQLRVELDGRKDISEIVGLLAAKGIAVEEVVKCETSLEDIYARVVGARQ